MLDGNKGPKKRVHILLVNFTEADAELLRLAGFEADRGFIGRGSSSGSAFVVPSYLPHPPFDYDIYVYNSEPSPELSKEFTSVRNVLSAKEVIDPLSDLNRPPWVRISFVGDGFTGLGDRLTFGGAQLVKLKEANQDVAVLLKAESDTFAIDEIHHVLGGFIGQVRSPIKRYLTVNDDIHPFRHIPAIFNRNGDQVAAYCTTYNRDVGETRPHYIVLPQLQSNVKGLIAVLGALRHVVPQLFPKEQRQWYESDEFAFSEERRILDEMVAKERETANFMVAKQSEREQVRSKFGFIKEILISTEDAKLEKSQRLSSKVRRVLEFIGFQVEDIDEKVKGAIRKEDLWVKDGTFLATTEVTGTANKNPKAKEFNDILGRMATIYKRRDLVPEAENVTGLLIVNYDIDTHPDKRPGLYAGDSDGIVEAAKDNSIGLFQL